MKGSDFLFLHRLLYVATFIHNKDCPCVWKFNFLSQISPREIESVILRHPGVLDVAVIGVPGASTGFVPKALITRKPGYPDLTEKQLLAFVNGQSCFILNVQ